MFCSGRETIFKISICFDKIISVPERFVKGRPRFLLNSWFGIDDTRASSLFYGQWSCSSRTLGDNMLAARCLLLNSYLIDNFSVHLTNIGVIGDVRNVRQVVD